MKSLLLICCLSIACSPERLVADEPQKPDIVVYLADDLSAADLSLYGGANIQTPAIDRLAAEGLTFNKAFVASPSCAVSRAALLTGLMPARNGARRKPHVPEKEYSAFAADT